MFRRSKQEIIDIVGSAINEGTDGYTGVYPYSGGINIFGVKAGISANKKIDALMEYLDLEFIPAKEITIKKRGKK